MLSFRGATMRVYDTSEFQVAIADLVGGELGSISLTGVIAGSASVIAIRADPLARPRNDEFYNAAMNGTACGANSPSASSTSPTTPSPPANQASPIMPVITAAEASTMPTWKAAEDNS